MNNIAQKFAKRYRGTVAEKEECKKYLSPECILLFGINLNDLHANYMLLSENDLKCMSNETRKKCIKNQLSPFGNLKLIVYKDLEDKLNFKLLHGMASRLVAEMVSFCDDPEKFINLKLE